MSQVCFIFSLFLPVDSLRSSQAASVAILPSALLLSDFRSVHGGRSQFSRCCYLIIDLGSRLSTEAGPGTRRSHLISVVELGCAIPTLRHGAHHVVVSSMAIRASSSCGHKNRRGVYKQELTTMQ
jgi:hypothetical protein